MLFSLLFITLIMFYINFRWKRRKLYALAKKIPGTDGLPLIGHAFTFMGIDVRNNINDSGKLLQNNLPVSKIWAGSLLFIVVNSPDHSQAMLQSTACLKIPFIISRPFLHRYGLIIANGAVWQHHRKILSHSFKINILQQLMPIFNQKCMKFVEKLQPKIGAPEFDIGHYVAALTLETTMTGNFHYDHCFYGSKIISDIDHGKTLMMKRMIEPWWNFEWLFQRSKLYKDMKASITLLDAKIDEIIEAYKTNMNNNEHRGTFVIDQLMDPANNLTYEEIRDEIFIFIIAGYETSSVTLSAILLMIAMHKDVQRKMFEEVDENYDGGHIEMEDLHKFKYIEMVIKEALRLFPTVPFVPRKVTQEFQMREYTVPKDTILIDFLYFMHRNKIYWGEDADKFRPERFEPEEIKKIHPHAYAPFAAGKRVCIGNKYAMYFLKIALVHIFKHYEFSTTYKYEEITATMSPSLEIAQKYHVSVERRKS